MNRSSKNNEWISDQSPPEDASFAKRLRELWRDLQDQPRWKYEQLSPVQLLEKSKVHLRGRYEKSQPLVERQDPFEYRFRDKESLRALVWPLLLA